MGRVLCGKNSMWEDFRVGGNLCGRISVWEEFHVGGFPCGRNSVWDDFRVGGILFGKFLVKSMKNLAWQHLVENFFVENLSLKVHFVYKLFVECVISSNDFLVENFLVE